MSTRKRRPELDLLKRKAQQQLRIVFTSREKSKLEHAMKSLYRIATGEESSSVFVYEMGRYLLTSRDMQKIKETHANSHRWTYMKPLYAMLYQDLYVDLFPDGDVISNADLETSWR